MKIVLTGASLTGNKGASAMCLSVIAALKRKYGNNIDIGLLSPRPNEDFISAQELGISLFKYSGVLRRGIPNYFSRKLVGRSLFGQEEVLDSYNWADVIIDIHGINFSDSDTLTSTAVIPSAQILLAYLMNVPIVKFTQTFGPMERPAIKFFAKVFLPLASGVFPREQSARDALVALGIRNIEPVYVDSAFLLPATWPEVHEKPRDSLKTRVAFIPNAILLAKSKNYVETCSKLLSLMITEGCRPVMIMHYSKPSTDEKLLDISSNNDFKLIGQIVDALRVDERSCIEIYDSEFSSSELKGLIGSCDIAVASRYHALVAAISQSIPSFCVGWAGKYEGLLERVGLERYSFSADDMGEFDIAAVLENFRAFITEYSSGQMEVAHAVEHLKDECGKSYARLFEIVDSHVQ